MEPSLGQNQKSICIIRCQRAINTSPQDQDKGAVAKREIGTSGPSLTVSKLGVERLDAEVIESEHDAGECSTCSGGIKEVVCLELEYEGTFE